MASYGPFRIGADGKLLSSRATPLRDRTRRRILELRAERLALSQDERGEALKEHLTDYLEAQAEEKRRRQADAARVIRAHYREKEQAGADALVREIRRGIETCLELDGWSDEDVKTLLTNRPPREYPSIEADMYPNVDVGKLSDAYSWGPDRQGRYKLDLHGGQVKPEPEAVPLKLPPLTIRLGEVYDWPPKPKDDLNQSLNNYGVEATIPGGKKQEEE